VTYFHQLPVSQLREEREKIRYLGRYSTNCSRLKETGKDRKDPQQETVNKRDHKKKTSPDQT
jgi:hypothetical protein